MEKINREELRAHPDLNGMGFIKLVNYLLTNNQFEEVCLNYHDEIQVFSNYLLNAFMNIVETMDEV